MKIYTITLLIAGIIAGLIQFFVDYKKLPIDESSTVNMQESLSVDKWQKFLNSIKNHWQFFAYIILGIAGAFLVPLINELTNNGLRGINQIKDYVDCLSKPQNPKSPCIPLNNWYTLVLLGYGIVFGYSAVRIIRNIGTILLGNINKQQLDITKQQQDIQKELNDAKKEITDLKAKLPKGQQPQQSERFNSEKLAEKIQMISQVNENFGDDTFALKELNTLISTNSCEKNPPPWNNKPNRVANSLKLLIKQVDTLASNRKKNSDGSIGDLDHQQRNSDHNPQILDKVNNIGVVTAIDLTHDLANKCDCNILAHSFEINKDPRIKFVIWDQKIMNSSPIGDSPSWTWREYKGENPHDKHIHISVKCDIDSYDSVEEWKISVS